MTTDKPAHRFASVQVDRSRLDPETRRREPIPPTAFLTVFRPSGTSLRVELTPDDLAKLLHQAATAAAEVMTGKVPSRW